MSGSPSISFAPVIGLYLNCGRGTGFPVFGSIGDRYVPGPPHVW